MLTDGIDFGVDRVEALDLGTDDRSISQPKRGGWSPSIPLLICQRDNGFLYRASLCLFLMQESDVDKLLVTVTLPHYSTLVHDPASCTTAFNLLTLYLISY